tara:strand:+ start:84 stop:992 length:909 start_codon:yes stop_codon:yes gene_type:complete
MSVLYTPTSLEKGLKTLFLQHFSTEAALAPRIAHIESSDSDSEKYDWLGQSPTMQQFLDERRTIPLSNTSYSIENLTWEATITVSRNDLADNRTGSIQRRIQQMAATAAGHQNKLIINQLIDGTSATLGLCYDGTAMFGNSHPARGDEGGVSDNLLSGTGTTVAAVSADLATAKATMLNFANESSEPFFGDGVGSLAVVCSPSLEKVFRETLNAGMISNTSNVQVGMADLIVSPRLSDVDDWYLLNTGSARSLILQDREPLEFSALEGNSDSGFMRDQWVYGVRARYNVGVGFWQAGVKTVN